MCKSPIIVSVFVLRGAGGSALPVEKKHFSATSTRRMTRCRNRGQWDGRGSSLTLPVMQVRIRSQGSGYSAPRGCRGIQQGGVFGSDGVWRRENSTCHWRNAICRIMTDGTVSNQRRLPNPKICRTRYLGQALDFSKCLVGNLEACKYAVSFSGGVICSHPHCRWFENTGRR